MKHQSCKFGNKCRYFHPYKLKSNIQSQENNPGQKINDTEKLSYAQIVTKPYLQLHVQGVHSGQIHPAQPHYNVQESFLGQNSPIQQPFLGAQNNQKLILDLLLSLNQRMTNVEKVKIQM